MSFVHWCIGHLEFPMPACPPSSRPSETCFDAACSWKRGAHLVTRSYPSDWRLFRLAPANSNTKQDHKDPYGIAWNIIVWYSIEWYSLAWYCRIQESGPRRASSSFRPSECLCGPTIEARQLEHDRPPTPRQNNKDNQHKSSFHPTSMLEVLGAYCSCRRCNWPVGILSVQLAVDPAGLRLHLCSLTTKESKLQTFSQGPNKEAKKFEKVLPLA